MMKVKVAPEAGFCFGVRRAVNLALEKSKGWDGPKYSLGPLVHNSHVVEKLTRSGLEAIDDVGEAEPGGLLVIRSHGVGPDVLSEAQKRNLVVVDATCPFVKRAQRAARDFSFRGLQVVVVGDREHPEVKGIVAWAGGSALVVQNPEEAKSLPQLGAVGVVVQTTQTRENFASVLEVLKQKSVQVEVCNTICRATELRQQAAVELAREVDVMVVVGGVNSANTAKLAMLSRSVGTPTYQVETAGEIDPAWFEGAEVAGLTAGASTPDWIIEEVKNRMLEINEKNLQENGTVGGEVLNESSSTEVVKEAELGTVDGGVGAGETGEEQMHEEMKDAVEVRSLRPGDIIEGTVVHVGADEVLVDVGAKSEGVIPLKELACYNVSSPQDVVQVGDRIEVVVLKEEDSEGRLVLSKEKADAERAWVKLEKALESGEPVEGVVREVVKGGLVVDVGVRAFLPASLVERGYVEDLSKYVGVPIKAKVIELNRGRKKVILSRKAVLEEEFAKKRRELLENLQEGEVVNGIVRRLTQFGAFVDIGGLDGLLHISEMAWHRVNHPSDVVQVGDEIKVMVLRVDKENEKVSLSLKQVLPNPWDSVVEKYPVGSVVEARVVRLAPFGAFVELEPGVEGLVHISHLADRRVEKPDEVVSEGEEIKVKVLSVNPAEKRIRLSIREVNRERKARRSQDEQVRQQEPTGDGATATIGEMVGDIAIFPKK